MHLTIPDPAEQAPLVARSVTPPSPSGRGGTTLLRQRAPRSCTVFVMTPPNEHTSEGGRDDRGVPYHAESTLSLRAHLEVGSMKDGRKNTPLLCLTLGMASLGVSWVGHLRGCNSHGGSASGRASEACGCPFAGRDRHGDPLHTDQCFWRLLLALCAIATPEAVLGEWVAMLLRQWIEPLRKLHR